MELGKQTIDKAKNKCYAKGKGIVKVFWVRPPEGLNRKRLSKALGLILSEKDVADYLGQEPGKMTNL